MAGQERIQKKTAPKEQEAVQQEDVKTESKEEAEKLKDEIDDFLDEIDSVLDTEFDVSQYIQKGGQAVRVFIDTVKQGFLAPLRSLFPLGWQ